MKKSLFSVPLFAFSLMVSCVNGPKVMECALSAMEFEQERITFTDSIQQRSSKTDAAKLKIVISRFGRSPSELSDYYSVSCYITILKETNHFSLDLRRYSPKEDDFEITLIECDPAVGNFKKENFLLSSGMIAETRLVFASTTFSKEYTIQDIIKNNTFEVINY